MRGRCTRDPGGDLGAERGRRGGERDRAWGVSTHLVKGSRLVQAAVRLGIVRIGRVVVRAVAKRALADASCEATGQTLGACV